MSVPTLEFLIPGDLQAGTGGYHYDRRIIAGLRTLGWRVAVHELDASFPYPSAAALDHACAVLASLPDGALVLIDGLALGAMPAVAQLHCVRLALVALIHLPLAAEIGLARDVARRLAHSERRALLAVRHVVVTSRAQMALLSDRIASSRLSVIEPGTDEAPLAHGSTDGVVRMLCVATVNPGKGHDVLIDALAPLASQPWHLTCVGSLTRSPDTVERLQARLQSMGLVERVTLTGEVNSEAVSQYYLDADLFVLPTRYESYGMAVAEALSHGLPVISTRTGAIPLLVGEKAGLLVRPNDVDALHAALARALVEPALRASMRGGAVAVRGTLPRWPNACACLARILESVRSRKSCHNTYRHARGRPANNR